MTEILNDLLFQLSSEAQITIVFTGKNLDICQECKWLEYDFLATDTQWVISNGKSYVTIYLNHIQNALYDNIEDIYTLYLSEDEIISFILN